MKKRIAIIIDTLNGGGAEKVCLSLFHGMLAKNIDVHMIVLKKKCDYDIPKSKNIHFVFDSAKVKLSNYFVQKSATQKLQLLLNKIGYFDAYFSNLDITHYVVAKANLPNCFYVIHNSIEKTLAMFSPLKFIRAWDQRRTVDVLNGKRLITVSNGIKNEVLTGNIITPLDVTTIYNPFDLVDIENSANALDSEIPENDYVLFVGRIAKQKRVDILIQAFQYVKADIELVLLTNNLKKLNKLIASHNINNKKIIGLSFKQNPYPLMKQAKALVLSSDFEGLGMVLVEALACGTPVVSTDCEHGPNEILQDDLAQFLCPVGQPKQLAEKIDLAISYQVKSPNILKEVSLNKVIEQYLELCN